MKKSDWQYLIDTLLFICIMGIVIIGFLLGLVIPKGSSVAESSKYFLGLHRHGWGNIHFYLSIAFTALLLIHLMLSWKWIASKAKQIFKNTWKTSLFIIFILSLSTPLFLWKIWPKYTETHTDYEFDQRYKDDLFGSLDAYHSKEEVGNIVVTGQMTLSDIEKQTGIQARRLAEELGLPPTISSNERIGRLRRMHKITIQDIRDAISTLLKEMEINSHKIRKEEES